MLSFGGTVATELMELLETHKTEFTAPEPQPENNINIPNKPTEPKNSPHKNIRKDSSDSNGSNVRPLVPAIKNAVHPPPALPANQLPPRPPMPPANARPAPPRPNNVSFVLQPVMGGVVPPMYPPPRLAPPQIPPQMYPNYYEYPWHFTYESFDRHHGNVNLNFNLPPKNLVVNSRSGSVECKNACVRPHGPEGDPIQYGPPPQNQGCWIKPTIFYDGFWTEQKVKKWVAEQVEKQFPEDASQKSVSPSNGQEASK